MRIFEYKGIRRMLLSGALFALFATSLSYAGLKGLKLPSVSDLKSLPSKVKQVKEEAIMSEVEQSLNKPTESRPKSDGFKTLVEVPNLSQSSQIAFPAMEKTRAIDNDRLEKEKEKRTELLVKDLAAEGPFTDLAAKGSPTFLSLREEAFSVLESRHRESLSLIEEDGLEAYNANVDWSPRFPTTGYMVSQESQLRAVAASHSVAQFATYLDRPYFIVAYATAVCSLDLENVTSIRNAAAAILSSGERLYAKNGSTKSLQEARSDASLLYRYSIASGIEDEAVTAESFDSMLDLGNLYIDMGEAQAARPILVNAWRLVPESWDAALALASCYMLEGKPDLARATLEDKRVVLPAMYAGLVKSAENINETSKAAELSPESPESEIESEVAKLQALETITAADFVNILDEDQVRKARLFVDNLAVKGRYEAPGFDALKQYSTVQAINTPGGIDSLTELGQELGAYAQLFAVDGVSQSEDSLAQLGMSVRYNVDIKDVMAHPERYEGVEIRGTVSGADQAMSRAEERLRLAQQARVDLENGKADTLLGMVAQNSPSVSIFSLRPYQYANPSDVLIQQYNSALLARKITAYNAYFFAVNAKTRASLEEIERIYHKKLAAIRKQEEAEYEKLQKQLANSNLTARQVTLKEHALHLKYADQYNALTEHAWNEVTQSAGLAYDRKIKPKVEQFYYDVLRNVALVSDPNVRQEKNTEFERYIRYAVFNGLSNVLRAYASCEYIEEWDCHCDIESLLALEKAEQEEFDRLAAERFAKSEKDRVRFVSKDIPESSPLFKRLDEYGTDLDIPGIPFLSGRISQARSVLKLSGKFQVKYAPEFNYTFSENAFTGATSHAADVSVGIKGENGNAKASAVITLKGAISFDGKGVVSDYSVLAIAKADLEAGPVGTGVSGEIGYSSKVGFTVDRVANFKVSFGQFGRSNEISFETSARRGNTLSYKAEQEFNPFKDAMNEEIKELVKESLGKEMSEFIAIDTSMKKEVWSGSFAM